MSPLAAYVLLFVAVGAGFIFVHLLAGKFIRPSKPGTEKLTIYECGEPTIGSSWVQFDLRFYVIALLFVIFDVEVAFFFPWAEVFGKANALANAPMPSTPEEARRYGQHVLELIPDYSENAVNRKKYLEPNAIKANDFANNRQQAQSLSWLAFGEILVFFGVLLVGFAYLWKRGDLAWVRSMSERSPKPPPVKPTIPLADQDQVLVSQAVPAPVIVTDHGVL